MYHVAMIGVTTLTGVGALVVALHASNADPSFGLFVGFIGMIAQTGLGMFIGSLEKGSEVYR